MTIPAPRTPDLRSAPVLRWGVLAPGGIARDWVASVAASTGQRVTAVGSRSADRARAFAADFGVERAHGTYEDLVADDDVDIVYIAAPHSEHTRLALLAIAAGKHVLVEKPLATSAAEATEIATAARGAGVFAMEAMWTRFLPQTDIVRQLIENGDLGRLGLVTADFGSVATADPAHRINDPALGGGALLDLGVYPVSFAHFALGRPERVTARGSLTPTGVDAQSALVLDAADGAQALLSTSLRARTPSAAAVYGDAGSVAVHPSFWGPSGVTVSLANRDPETWIDPSGMVGRDALCVSAVAAAIAIAEGRTEHPLHTLSDAIEVLESIDEARSQLGAS
ncbi:Gfo/Idh/MocA family protein [Planctomonas psychrotolerans]|uniref:Gfo/Idh/MocA family protein n=1 Tax=Planctomonas psychrotolerans TaxID=2528712 RepID=UPI0012384633|nr:Gfo/Idh/MocA family oxidoreductase [Planctomonas psychrotolerans]